jgi:hypothetical protein
MWFVLFAVLSASAFATEGTFLGTIVDPPAQQTAAPGWIFVQGRNHMIRRVDVTHAAIIPAQKPSGGQSGKCGPECLAVGQEVRITAEQDTAGEWRAKRVEILSPEPGKTPAPKRSSALNNKTLPSQNLGCWITIPGGLRIQPITEKSLITRWSGGIMNDVL